MQQSQTEEVVAAEIDGSDFQLARPGKSKQSVFKQRFGNTAITGSSAAEFQLRSGSTWPQVTCRDYALI